MKGVGHGVGKTLLGRQLLVGVTYGCALAVFLLAGLALVGWLVEMPGLRSFGGERIPMAPSTALLLLVYAAVVPELQWRWRPAWWRRSLVVVVLTVTAMTAVLLISSAAGHYSTLEHLGMEISGTLNGVPLGQMSPLTALCFLLVGAVALCLVGDGAGADGTGRAPLPGVAGGSDDPDHAPGPRRLWPSLLSLVLASMVSLLAFALLLAYLLGSPIFYGSGLVPPALPTSLAFFLLATALQGQALGRLRQLVAGFRLHPSYYGLALILVVLIGGILVVGFVSYRHEEQERRAAMSRQLSSVVELKAERIGAWLKERDNRGRELMNNQGFADRIEQWLRHDVVPDREIIINRLVNHLANYDYDGIMLLAPDHRQLVGLGECLELGPVLTRTLERAERHRQVERSDLYRCPAGQIRLHWVVPIVATADGRLLAFVVQQMPATNFLFPFLTAWDGSERSTATDLARREGDEVLLLGGSRRTADEILNHRISLQRREVPLVQAALGREGVWVGSSERGVPVLAAIKAVPEAEWLLSTRIDMAEVYAPLSGTLWVLALVVTFLLGGSGGGVFLLWRWQLNANAFALLTLAAARDQATKKELERLVARRTAQLETLNKELESFSYSVSHDLKAPLRGIKGYADLLARDYRWQLDQDGRLFIDHIGKGATEMRQMIDGLLAYSRMERQPNSPRRVNLAALVRSVLDGFADRLAANGVVLELEVPEHQLEVDSQGLAMVLRNLVDNAIKFSRRAAPPRLSISAEADQEWVWLTVRDNGCGFDMKFGEQVFEIFTRLDGAEEVAGSGVGLAMVRRAVWRMGGTIKVAAEPGRGTVFTLGIPRQAGNERQ